MLVKDVYFLKEYYNLYASIENAKYSLFEFSVLKRKAEYPFFIKKITGYAEVLKQDYYDIQTSYGYGGVISNNYNQTFIEQFYKKFNSFCLDNNIIAEFVRFHPLIKNNKFSENYMDVILDRETVALDLQKSFDDIWLNEYSSKNRNMIRKAEKLGYSIEIISTPTKSEIERFIDIYEYSMKMANADEFYFFDREFFFNTFKYLKDIAFLFNVKSFGSEVVCSAIFFHYKNYFNYHLSGRTEKADNSVNNFLLNEAVKFAQKKGAKVFHFGGGRSKSSDDSLLKFKSNFSKTKLPFYIGKKIHNKEVYDEVIRQWEFKNPDKLDKYKNYLLKYRY